MAQLALSPTRKHFRIGDKNDFVVLVGSRVIGRIFLQPLAAQRLLTDANPRRAGYFPSYLLADSCTRKKNPAWERGRVLAGAVWRLKVLGD
jgi:hypothetical protein